MDINIHSHNDKQPTIRFEKFLRNGGGGFVTVSIIVFDHAGSKNQVNLYFPEGFTKGDFLKAVADAVSSEHDHRQVEGSPK